jgi:hypothetical protein
VKALTTEQTQMIYAAIDGEVGDAQRIEFETLLASSVEARDLFTELLQYTTALSSMADIGIPADLSAALRDNLDGLAAQAKAIHERISNQSVQHSTTEKKQHNTQSSRGTLAMSNKENGSFSSNKVWAAVGALAITVAVVGYLDLGSSVDNSNISGSIASAERYQSDTIEAKDVVLGDQAIVDLLQSDSFVSLIEDESFVELMSSGRFAKLMADGRFAKLMADGRFAKLMADGRFAKLMADGRFAALMADGRFAALMADGRFAALQADGRLAALQADGRFAQLMADGRFAQLMADGRFSQLMADGRFAQLMADGRFAQLMADGRFAQLMADGRFALLMADGRWAALMADGRFSQLMADGRFAFALQRAFAAEGRIAN